MTKAATVNKLSDDENALRMAAAERSAQDKAAKDAANGEAGKVGAAKVKQGNEVGAKSAIEKPAGDPVAVGGP